MDMVRQWTGREVRALRDALRMSVQAFANHTNLGTTTISDLEAKGAHANPRRATQRILDEVLAAAPEHARQRFRTSAGAALLRDPETMVIGRQLAHDQIPTHGEIGNEVKRRDVLTGGGVIAADAALSLPAGTMSALGVLEEVAGALTGESPHAQVQHWPEDLSASDLAEAGAALKRSYQAGRYREVIEALPRLLRMVRAVDMQPTTGNRLSALAAGIYQTACSVLLKLGDGGLAVLAADRSMAAAHRSGDPIAAGGSARALAHALASGGHHALATTIAMAAAEQIKPGRRSGPLAELAVYGALLLRASLVAAVAEDRHTALETLAEADEISARIDGDDNASWAYFCPTNVSLHRVSVAVSLGDAGQAMEHASRVDPRHILLAERRACFYVDLSRASLQCGKHNQAYEALQAAERAAPQEVTARPLVAGIVNELQRRCPPSIYGHVTELARRVAG